MMWAVRVREAIRTRLWPIPSLCVLVSAGLAIGALTFDRTRPSGPGSYLFVGSADGARALLSTTSAAMLTFMALVFSITIVALQLASAQFSPRVQRAFLRDTFSKLTLGVFIGTYTYTILVLQAVRSPGEGKDSFVPGLSTIIAVVLVLASVGMFVRYTDHIARSIRAVSVIRRVAAEASDVIENLFPDPLEGTDEENGEMHIPPDGWNVPSATSGVVVGIDTQQLMNLATEQQILIKVVPMTGDFVPSKGVLAHVVGRQSDAIVESVRRAISVGSERTMRQDVAFGLRQLVDIADRALSPGINDPTTAVQALDAIHDLLRRIVTQRFPPEVHVDANGTPRVFVPSASWTALLSLAVDEIRRSGSESLQVARRLRDVLEDVAALAPATRKRAVLKQLESLESSVTQHFERSSERRLASRPSRQGNL